MEIEPLDLHPIDLSFPGLESKEHVKVCDVCSKRPFTSAVHFAFDPNQGRLKLYEGSSKKDLHKFIWNQMPIVPRDNKYLWDLQWSQNSWERAEDAEASKRFPEEIAKYPSETWSVSGYKVVFHRTRDCERECKFVSKMCFRHPGTDVKVAATFFSNSDTKEQSWSVPPQAYKNLVQRYENETPIMGTDQLAPFFEHLCKYLHRNWFYESTSSVWGLKTQLFQQLKEKFGVNRECFAMAHSSTLPYFHSPFPDTDLPFGSQGSFFDQRFPVFDDSTPEAYEVNPPWVNHLLMHTAQHMLEACERAQKPILFFVFFPDWIGTKGFKDLDNSVFKIYQRKIQHQYQDVTEKTQTMRADQRFFLMGSRSAKKRWDKKMGEALTDILERKYMAPLPEPEKLGNIVEFASLAPQKIPAPQKISKPAEEEEEDYSVLLAL